MATEQSMFPELQIHSIDCLTMYLAYVNAAQTPHQIDAMLKAENAAFWRLILLCVDRLIPDAKHLFEMRPFITAHYLAPEVFEMHKTMFSQHTYALAKAVLRDFRTLCQEPHLLPTMKDAFCALLQEYNASCNHCFLHNLKVRIFDAVEKLHEANFIQDVYIVEEEEEELIDINLAQIFQEAKDMVLLKLSKVLPLPDFEAFCCLVDMYDAYQYEHHTLYYLPHERCFSGYDQ